MRWFCVCFAFPTKGDTNGVGNKLNGPINSTEMYRLRMKADFVCRPVQGGSTSGMNLALPTLPRIS